MTDVGIKGLDLYCWEENGQWRFVNSARPNGKTNQVNRYRQYAVQRKRIYAISSSL